MGRNIFFWILLFIFSFLKGQVVVVTFEKESYRNNGFNSKFLSQVSKRDIPQNLLSKSIFTEKYIYVLNYPFYNKEGSLFFEFKNNSVNIFRYENGFITAIKKNKKLEFPLEITLHLSEKRNLKYYIYKNNALKLSNYDSLQYFAIQQNALLAKYENEIDSFNLILSDDNLNGIYGDPEDMLYIVNNKLSKLDVEILGKSSIPFSNNFFVETNNNKYYFEDIKLGNKIFSVKKNLIKTDKNKTLILIDALPKINLISQGNTIPLATYLSGKLLYIDFWSSWCSPCKKNMDTISKYFGSISKKISVLSLNYSDDTTFISKYFKDNKYNWHWGKIQQNESTFFNQNGFPFGILYDSNGKLIKYFRNFDSLVKYLSHER